MNMWNGLQTHAKVISKVSNEKPAEKSASFFVLYDLQ
ncbi:MAG: hypothetical protein K0R98_2044 [Rickettsiaceae bacterium]|jgi:hypothetical protein|nr:hypothetical protein [Rickettsiaceae bacterium]